MAAARRAEIIGDQTAGYQVGDAEGLLGHRIKSPQRFLMNVLFRMNEGYLENVAAIP
jgi:hypothetical protein